MQARQMRDDLEDLAILAKCREDPWEFSKYLFTKDEKDKKVPKKRFPYHLPHIKLALRILQRENRVAIPKSRRMQMTWTCCAFIYWEAVFHPGIHSGVVSKKEDDADWLLENRIKFLHDNIDPSFPKHLLPTGKKTKGVYQFIETGSVIQGFPQGAHQLRQYTLATIFADELAFWEDAAGTYEAALPTLEGGGRFIGISSAEPSYFMKIVFDSIENDSLVGERDHEVEVKRPIPGVEIWRNKVNEFLVLQIYYLADPAKRSAEWKANASKGMSKKQWDKEYEIIWITHSGRPVYPDYSKHVHASEDRIYPDIGLPLLLGFDFGLMPALIVAQIKESKLYVFKEYIGVNMGIERFCDVVIPQLFQMFPQWRSLRDDYITFIDPAGFNRNEVDERTCAMALATKGFKPMPGAMNWEQRRSSVERKLSSMSNGTPDFIVDSQMCPLLCRGFEGGYRYDDKDLLIEKSKIRPIKDEHSHPHDALQMITTGATNYMRSYSSSRKVPSPSYAR